MAENTKLDSDLILRPARMTDAGAVAQLTQHTAELEGDALFVMNADELANEWASQGFEVERDVRVVETRDGRLVGSEEFYNESGHVQLKADGCVHPNFRGRGIGSALLAWAQERARAEMEQSPPGLRVILQSMINQRDAAGHSFLQTNGFGVVRYFWRMEIKLQSAPQAPSWPTGIELRPFVQTEHAEAVWQADDEAFLDHWGSHARSFEDWSHTKFGNPNFDPALWLVAWDGDQIAGFSQNRYRKGIGWVGTIAVRRLWRSLGLGLALMQQTFGEFFKRGTNIIGLGVDSANLTGATRLYQKAGMTAAGEFALYQKELRAAAGSS